MVRNYVKRGRPISKAQVHIIGLPTDRPDECMFLPYPNRRIAVGGTTQTPTRASCHFHHGPPSEGQVAVQTCTSPGCINPCHVRWGTFSEALERRRPRTKKPREIISDAEVYQLRMIEWGGLIYFGQAARAAGVSPKYLRKIIDGKTRRAAGFPPGWKTMAGHMQAFRRHLVERGLMMHEGDFK